LDPNRTKDSAFIADQASARARRFYLAVENRLGLAGAE
jgi:hypothetical protein